MPDAPCEDRRTRRTISAIKTAFWETASEKGFDNVTVTEIAERADINRKTFYHHYESIEMLQDELLAERIALMSDSLRAGVVVKDGMLDIESLFQAISAQIAIAANRNGSSVAQVNAERLINHMEPILVRAMLESIPEFFEGLSEENLRYVAVFFGSGLLAAYRRWLCDNSEIPLEELAATLGACIAGGIPYFEKYEREKEG